MKTTESTTTTTKMPPPSSSKATRDDVKVYTRAKIKMTTNAKALSVLKNINDKKLGEIVTIDDLILYTIEKLTDEDIENLREFSFSLKDRNKIRLMELSKKLQIEDEDLLIQKAIDHFETTI